MPVPYLMEEIRSDFLRRATITLFARWIFWLIGIIRLLRVGDDVALVILLLALSHPQVIRLIHVVNQAIDRIDKGGKLLAWHGNAIGESDSRNILILTSHDLPQRLGRTQIISGHVRRTLLKQGSETLGDKYMEVDYILDAMGSFESLDPCTNIITIRTPDDRLIKVADLVNEDGRDKVVSYLNNVRKPEDIDIIIALGMAKEGFDWPFCEETLTVGYRGSLTEIVQIIGRCTRDSENKTHAQFTNLIAEPDASRSEIAESVNNMLKAISASLLMEQVVAPKLIFKPKGEGGPGTIEIGGLRKPSTPRTINIVENDLTELKAAVLQDEEIQRALSGQKVETDIVNKTMIPKIIMKRYPDLTAGEVEEVRENLITDMVLRESKIVEKGGAKFINLANSFINVEDINVDLIDRINPFQEAFEVLSKDIDPRVLKAIQTCIRAYKISMTEDEAFLLWPRINVFVKKFRREPSLDAIDPSEKRMAEALAYLRALKANSSND